MNPNIKYSVTQIVCVNRDAKKDVMKFRKEQGWILAYIRYIGSDMFKIKFVK